MSTAVASIADRLAQGVKCHEAADFAGAERIYREILQNQPNHAEALHLSGLAALQLGQHLEAIDRLERAAAMTPNSAGYLANLGSAYGAVARFTDAAATLARSVELDATNPEAYNNLGLALTKLHRLDDAIAAFEQAFALRPDFAEAHRNRAVAWFFQGDYLRGWPEFEWRWKSAEYQPHYYTQPQWDGSPLAGRTILLHAEQGFGDTMMFVRFAQQAKERGGHVVVRCQSGLVELLRRTPGIDAIYGDDKSLPRIDMQAPLMSLPGILKLDVNHVASEPYILPDEALVTYWRHQLSRFREFKVGIAWQGSAKYAGDCFRSIALAELMPLAQVPGVRLISLQKGFGSEQIAQVADRFLVNDLGNLLDQQRGAFVDTAAAMQAVDLVITSDTAAAHLAGAIGVPVWLALDEIPEWRWMLERSDSPWYPTMRIFRQQKLGDWKPVFAEMASSLKTKAGQP
jgi:Flp pilus assembly protein TadD